LLSVEYLEGPMSTVDSVIARVRPAVAPPSQQRRAAVDPRVRHAGLLVHRLGHAVRIAVDRGADGWRPAVTP
jgi:hypothetical protein